VLDVASFTLPAELRASLPAELRGLPRDHVRLMVIDRRREQITHTHFHRIRDLLEPGDLLVLNSSRTLPDALPARRENGEAIEVRPCVRRAKLWDVLAVQPESPHANVPLKVGERITLDGATGTVQGRRPDIPLLWRVRLNRDGLDPILRAGQPIRYSYVPQRVPLEHYQTVYATRPGSAETPSAGRAFTWELLLGLRKQGITIADVVLHAGLSSFQDDVFDAEHHLFEEWFEASAETAAAVRRARRVIAVGTTVVRALESAAGDDGTIRAASGWTELRIAPGSRLRVVHALLTGFHEPQASHFDLLRAFVEEPLLERAYQEAIEQRYLWHEFGDEMLIL